MRICVRLQSGRKLKDEDLCRTTVWQEIKRTLVPKGYPIHVPFGFFSRKVLIIGILIV